MFDLVITVFLKNWSGYFRNVRDLKNSHTQTFCSSHGSQQQQEVFCNCHRRLILGCLVLPVTQHQYDLSQDTTWAETPNSPVRPRATAWGVLI